MKKSTFWRLLILGYVGVAVILGCTAYSLIKNPPPPPPQYLSPQCAGTDAGNPWGCQK